MIANPRFEIAAAGIVQPGIPANWGMETLGTAEETAEFAGDQGLTFDGAETFDHGWTAMNPQILLVSLGVSQLIPPEDFGSWVLDLEPIRLIRLFSLTFHATRPTFEDFSQWGSFRAFFEPTDTSAGTTDPFIWGLYNPSLLNVSHAAFGTADGGLAGVPFDAFTLKRAQIATIDNNQLRLRNGQSVELVTGERVTFLSTDGRIPNDLSEGFVYYIGTVSAGRAGVRRTASSTSDIEIANDGIGDITIIADPGQYWTQELL